MRRGHDLWQFRISRFESLIQILGGSNQLSRTQHLYLGSRLRDVDRLAVSVCGFCPSISQKGPGAILLAKVVAGYTSNGQLNPGAANRRLLAWLGTCKYPGLVDPAGLCLPGLVVVVQGINGGDIARLHPDPIL